MFQCIGEKEQVTKKYFVCEHHFKADEIRVNDLLLAMHSETNPDRTKLLEKEIDYLKEKMNFLEAEKNVLKAENDKQTRNEHL